MPHMDASHHTSGALVRELVIGLTAFLTVVDLFATQAILPSLVKHYGVSPAAMSLAVNATLEAVKQSGRDIKVAGYDSEATGYMAFHDGNTNLVALSGQQAAVQGRAAIDGLSQAVLGGTLCDEIITPNLLVTKENFTESWPVQYPGGKEPWAN